MVAGAERLILSVTGKKHEVRIANGGRSGAPDFISYEEIIYGKKNSIRYGHRNLPLQCALQYV